MKFCSECGSKLPEGAKFCGECGTKVNGGSVSKGDDLNEKANAICKSLLDLKNEGVFSGRVTADMLPVIKKAADAGNGLAAFVMGKLHYGGLEIDGNTVVEDNEDKMLDYYRKGAEAGDLFAQSEYGQVLCNEYDDEASGYPWIKKSGENGNVFSLHRMTYAYLDGSYGQEVDFGKALECFKAIVNEKDTYDWPEEMIIRAKGYLQFLPAIIGGDVNAMEGLGKWLKQREAGWDYTWGLGDAGYESEFWLKKAKGDEDDDEDEAEDVEEDDEAEDVDEAEDED